MRALILLAIAGCYSPQFAPCEVSCDHDSPCPEDYACGSDSYCHANGDATTCNITLMIGANGPDGHVSSNPNGVDCGTHDPQPCSVTFAPNTQITLSAHGDNAQFGHWSGDACNGSNNPNCTFTLHNSMMISASFH